MDFFVFRAGQAAGYEPSVTRVDRAPAAALTGKTLPSTIPRRARRTSSPPMQAYERAAEKPKVHREVVQTVSQIMSAPVVTVSGEMPVTEASTLCHRHAFRHLPVQGSGGALVGMVSDRDLLGVQHLAPRRLVRDVMTREVLTALTTTPVRSAAGVMVDEGISALPVIDDGHVLVGIVTTSDLLRCIVNDGPLDLWI